MGTKHICLRKYVGKCNLHEAKMLSTGLRITPKCYEPERWKLVLWTCKLCSGQFLEVSLYEDSIYVQLGAHK